VIHQEIVARLERNREVICSLVSSVPPEQARWKPSEKQWSILEVINHLDDEERDDFRKRIDLTLHQPDRDWPPIDPARWCVERRYNERDLEESVKRFAAERERSILWLRGLGSPDWDRFREHPRAGVLRAGDLLASWLAHDYLHIRQLTRLHLEHHRAVCGPYSTEYAG
jgi:hypothetical protein